MSKSCMVCGKAKVVTHYWFSFVDGHLQEREDNLCWPCMVWSADIFLFLDNSLAMRPFRTPMVSEKMLEMVKKYLGKEQEPGGAGRCG